MTNSRMPFEIFTVDKTQEVYDEKFHALPSWKRKIAHLTPLFRPEVNACFQLTENWLYRAEDGFTYLVPKGFRFDYASIPQAAQSIIPKMGPWNPAAMLHDYLYRTNFFGNGSMAETGRAHADRMLHEVMRICDVDLMTQETIYDAVRIGGGSSYYEADKTALLAGRALFQAEFGKFRDSYQLAFPAALEVLP